MSALCRSLNMIILIHIVQTFLLSYSDERSRISTIFCKLTHVQWLFQYDWGWDHCGCEGFSRDHWERGGLKDHQWYKGNDIQKCRKMKCSIFCFIPDQWSFSLLNSCVQLCSYHSADQLLSLRIGYQWPDTFLFSL